MTPRLAPDPVLPFRDDLLDPARASRMIEWAFALRGVRCRALRVTYRIGESIRAVLEVGGGSGALVGVRMEAPDRADALLTRVRAACPSAVLVPQSGAVIWRFPEDRKLRGLGALAPASPVVAALLRAPAVRAQVLRWTPEKSATAACRDADGRTVAFAKAYATDDLHRTAALHELLESRGCRVPPVVHLDAGRRLLLVAPVAGAPVDVARDPVALAAVGEALAHLHAVPPPPGERHGRLDPEGLPRAAELLGRARPDVGERAAELADRLLAARPALEEDVLVHGDVHLGNVLLGQGGARLIDLDQAAAGQAAAELGSLLAVLRALHVVGQLTAEGEAVAAGALLAGYSSVAQLPERASIGWHLAAALLVERALRAVRRARPDALAHLDDLLREADRACSAVTA